MKKLLKLSALSVLTMSVSSVMAQSNNNDDSWYDISGKAYLGYGYDSNVSVSELDTNTDTSDTATHTNAMLKAKITPTERWTLTAAAQYTGTRYHEQSAFNLAVATYSGEISYQSPWAKVGLHHYHANADLDSQRYLTYKQTGISAANGFLEQAYWRLSADSIEKELPTAAARNSDAQALRGDVFWFFKADTFLKMGATYHDEDAVDANFDYAGKKLDVSYALPFTLFAQASEVTLAYEYEQRQYATENEGGIGREDDRQRIKASVEYPLYEFADLTFRTQYGHYDSTLLAADYKETLAELGIKLHF